MMRACSRCGKMHDINRPCPKGREYSGGNERKLRSKYVWTLKSKEVREKACYLCEVCRDQNIFTFDNIEVHHITKVKDDESLYLDNDNLICLCKGHHLMADKGEINKDYLISLAKKREDSVEYLS